jgi:hypothetical protein
MLCRPCNNARTKSFDQAYQQFSDWVLAAAPTLHSKKEINFAEIYGSAYIEKSLALMRYFAKRLIPLRPVAQNVVAKRTVRLIEQIPNTTALGSHDDRFSALLA